MTSALAPGSPLLSFDDSDFHSEQLSSQTPPLVMLSSFLCEPAQVLTDVLTSDPPRGKQREVVTGEDVVSEPLRTTQEVLENRKKRCTGISSDIIQTFVKFTFLIKAKRAFGSSEAARGCIILKI